MRLPTFLRVDGPLIAYGVVMCFCSSPGQTFFISLFGGEIRAAFGLSHGEFGTVYMVGTLASAAVLIWTGRFVDRIPLALVSAGVIAGLAGMCFLMGNVGGVIALTVAVFGLRQFGQGLSVHTALTAMARYFDRIRGRAISIASLGNTAGAASAPILVVAALAVFEWRTVWIVTGLGLLLTVPVLLFLLRGHGARHRALVDRLRTDTAPRRDRTLGLVLRDPGLWLRLPALLAHSFVSTGLIFHQVHLAEDKGWSLSLLAASFSVYAVAALLALVLSGQLVDRWTATRLMPFALVPLTMSCAALVVTDSAWAAPVFLAFLGISGGFTAVVKGALWAELYGVGHLGAIRAFGQSAMVFASGLAPATMGLAIDLGVSMAIVALASAGYCIVASILAGVAKRPRPLAEA